MKKVIFILLFLFLITGCEYDNNEQENYENLKTEYEELKIENEELNSNLKYYKSEYKYLKSRYDELLDDFEEVTSRKGCEYNFPDIELTDGPAE